MRWLVSVLALPLCAAPLTVDVSAPSAILINADTGKILFEKNGRARHYPASTTKIATAKLAFELAGDHLDEIVEAQSDALIRVEPEVKRVQNFSAPSHWNETDGKEIGIVVGERMPLSMLLAALLVESANDAANVIGQHLSGSVPAFVELLNARLAELGLRETHFTNPHGLHHPEHVTTAFELAQLGCWAWSEPRIRELAGQARWAHAATNGREPGWFRQTNQLVCPGRYYDPRVVGLKTGYHAAAGYTLVAVAEQERRTLVAVLLGCRNADRRYADASALLDAAFSEEPRLQHIHVVGRRFRQRRFLAAPAEDIRLWIYPSEEANVHLVAVWHPLPRQIAKGDPVGELRATTEEGVILAAVPLVATRRVGGGVADVRLWLIGAGALLIVWLIRPRKKG